ncbi:MAG: hypothetical protein KDC57_09410 [Saprospiraceae bacterium]|nr:hypothetical protein [Saprospiraceae bacterium]
MRRKQALVHWNGEMTTALALYEAKVRHNVHPVTLLTPIAQPANQNATQGLAAHLIERQAMSMGLPLQPIYHTEEADSDEMCRNWQAVIGPYRTSVGIDWLVAEEVDENLLQHVGVELVRPLAGMEGAELADRFLGAGFQAWVSAVNASWLEGDFVGLAYDEYFVRSLPKGVDPFGRRGEFHTYVYDGPLFRRPVPVVAGDRFFKNWSFSARLQAYWYVGLELTQ